MLLPALVCWTALLILDLLILAAGFHVMRLLMRRMEPGKIGGAALMASVAGTVFIGLAAALGAWFSFDCSTVYVYRGKGPGAQTRSTHYLLGAGARYRFRNGAEQWMGNSGYWILVNDSDSAVELPHFVTVREIDMSSSFSRVVVKEVKPGTIYQSERDAPPR